MRKLQQPVRNEVIPTLNFRLAKIPLMFDNIRVIIDSDEKIFEEVYVTGLLPNNRVAKFKKASLEFVC